MTINNYELINNNNNNNNIITGDHVKKVKSEIVLLNFHLLSYQGSQQIVK